MMRKATGTDEIGDWAGVVCNVSRLNFNPSGPCFPLFRMYKLHDHRIISQLAFWHRNVADGMSHVVDELTSASYRE